MCSRPPFLITDWLLGLTDLQLIILTDLMLVGCPVDATTGYSRNVIAAVLHAEVTGCLCYLLIIRFFLRKGLENTLILLSQTFQFRRYLANIFTTSEYQDFHPDSHQQKK